MEDKLFDTNGPVGDFTFDSQTANVFDDMVNRSVPLYSEIQRMCCELATYHAKENTNLYDIGCATGTTLIRLNPEIDTSVNFIGIDNSDDMLNKAKSKLSAESSTRNIELLNVDINSTLPTFENSSVIIMLLTLQFIRPSNRSRVVKAIYDSLVPNGCFILVEKISLPDSGLNRMFIDGYYNYKRRHGYSELEISKKREALENVLIPYHHQENIELLNGSGFSRVAEFFRWFNFTGVVSVK